MTPKMTSITISDNTESFTEPVAAEIWESREHLLEFLDGWSETYVHFTNIEDETTAEREFEVWETSRPEGRTETFIIEVAAELR